MKTSFNIIGVTGRKRHGKDTIADFLVTHGFVKRAFADPLKEGLRHIFKYNSEQLYGSKKKTYNPRWGETPRKSMQTVGTDMFRKIYGDDFWIKRLKLDLVEVTDKKQSIVISDVRFPNEADMIKSMGGTIIKVVRVVKIESSESEHISESSIDLIKADHVVKNNGTIADLEKRINRIVGVDDSTDQSV